ncbi:hypothetical protein [Streptomyces sp. NPDC001020]
MARTSREQAQPGADRGTLFLSPTVRDALACVPGSKAPHLSASFESSVRGLYSTGSLAAPMLGPMMRFVAGTEFAVAHIAQQVADNSAAR